MSVAPAYQTGQLVRLRSGGPAMTVESVAGSDMLSCVWFVDDIRRSAWFPASALEPTTLAETKSGLQRERLS